MLKIIISGKGGQGIQFTALLLSKTAIHAGMYVTMQKSYGPEARGGASQSSVIIDGKPITNPIIKRCDFLVAFNEEAKNTWGTKADKIIYLDNADNMFALGRLLQEIKLFSIDDVIKTLKEEISSKYADRLEINIKNLQKGYNL